MNNIFRNIVKFRRPKQVAGDLSNEQQKILDACDSLNKSESVIFYTTHKCASTFVFKLLDVICKDSDYTVVNYASAIWQLGDRVDISTPYEDFLSRAWDQLYRNRGVIYAPQRRPLDFPGRTEFKHIFFLRDPRDVLVSAYYSFGYSHSMPKNSNARMKFSKQREYIKDVGIDQYVVNEAENWLLPIYDSYRQLLETSGSHLKLTYDDYKDDTGRFIGEIAKFLNVTVAYEDVMALAHEASPVQKSTDILKHKRSGKSQQFLHELRPDTIETINTLFDTTLTYWNFKKQQ